MNADSRRDYKFSIGRSRRNVFKLLWHFGLDTAGSLNLVALQGDQAPGMPAGTTFFAATSWCFITLYNRYRFAGARSLSLSQLSTGPFRKQSQLGNLWVSGPSGLRLSSPGRGAKRRAFASGVTLRCVLQHRQRTGD